MTLLITGATGLLGGHLLAEIARRGISGVGCGGPSRGAGGLDLCDRAAVFALFESVRPSAVIHTAALSAIAECARDSARARAINVDGAANVAAAANAVGARLVHVSTDLVFGGDEAPYAEDAAPAPTSVYGATKLASEEAVLGSPRAVIARVSLLFGPTRTARRGFFDQQLESLRAGTSIALFDDEWRTPLSLRAAAEGLVALAQADDVGVFHLGGPERMSRHEMGVRLARAASCSSEPITRSSRTAVAGEPRPRDVSLDTSRFRARFPELASGTFEEEIARMFAARP